MQFPMFGLDTANCFEIERRMKERKDIYAVRHVTTNPTLLKKIGIGEHDWFNYKSIVDRIIRLAGIECVSVETCGYDLKKEIYDSEIFHRETETIAQWSSKILIKVPALCEGFEAIKNCGFRERINITLVFNKEQALKAASLEVFCISPFLGRLDDYNKKTGKGLTGIQFLSELKELWDKYGITQTKILAASVRNAEHIKKSLELGVDMITMPPFVYDEFMAEVDNYLNHDPLLAAGLETFRKDWFNE